MDKQIKSEVIEHITFMLSVFGQVMLFAFIGAIISLYPSISAILGFKIVIMSAIIGALFGMYRVLKRMKVINE